MILPSLAAIDRELVRKGGLREFIPLAWPIVEPGVPYIPGWHIDAISDHLEAATAGEIRNLIINMPPRHMKSLLTCVMWFCWVWTFKPETRWMFSSYSNTFAIRDSVKCRSIIQSPWYQERWGKVFTLADDQNQKTRFDNTAKGFRMASSVSGGNTGEGGDFIVADDPLKALDAYSPPALEENLRWWNETMSTRGNKKGSVRVIVMQRLHESDLSGAMEAAMLDGGDHYEQLVLPAVYEGKKWFTGLGWSDPRNHVGDLLWPERFDSEWMERLAKSLGEYGAAGQLQQRPSPLGGGIIKRDNFPIIVDHPWLELESRTMYIDKAGTEGGGAYTAIILLSMNKKRQFFIDKLVRGQWSALERETIIKQCADNWSALDGPKLKIWVEQEPGSGGKESAENTIRMLAGYEVYADRVTSDKISRAMPVAAQIEAKNVSLVKGDWVDGFLDRASNFPVGKYKDDVDAMSGAFNKTAIPLPKEAKAR